MTDTRWGYSPGGLKLHLNISKDESYARSFCGVILRLAALGRYEPGATRCRTCLYGLEPLVCSCPVAYSDNIGQCTRCWRVITHHPSHPILADGWPELAGQPIHYQLLETA